MPNDRLPAEETAAARAAFGANAAPAAPNAPAAPAEPPPIAATRPAPTAPGPQSVVNRPAVTFNATFNVAAITDPEAFVDHVSRALRQRFQQEADGLFADYGMDTA